MSNRQFIYRSRDQHLEMGFLIPSVHRIKTQYHQYIDIILLIMIAANIYCCVPSFLHTIFV